MNMSYKTSILYNRRKFIMPKEEQNFKIWCEGYSCTGEKSEAIYHGVARGKTFKDACMKYFSGSTCFDSDRMTYWGCRLFDNEAEARKSFG
jgi:hypothetical protein